MKTVKGFCGVALMAVVSVLMLLGLPVKGALISPPGGTMYGFFMEIPIEVSSGERIRSIAIYGPCWPGEGQEFTASKGEIVPPETQNTFTIYPFSQPWDLVSGEYVVSVSVVLPGGGVRVYTSQRFNVQTSIPLIRILSPDTRVIFVPGQNVNFQFQVYGLGGEFSSVGLCVVEPSRQFSCTNDPVLDLSQGQVILTNNFNWTIPAGYQDGRYSVVVYSANRQDIPGVGADFLVDSNPTVVPKITIEEGPSGNNFWINLDDSAQPGMRRRWVIEASTDLNSWVAVTAPMFAGKTLVLSPSSDGKIGFFRAKEHR